MRMDREYWNLCISSRGPSRAMAETAEQAYELALIRIRRDLADSYQRFADNNV